MKLLLLLSVVLLLQSVEPQCKWQLSLTICSELGRTIFSHRAVQSILSMSS